MKPGDYIVDEHGCWVWQRDKSAEGYGRVYRVGWRTSAAHRMYYEIARGPIPGGLELDHLCRNPSCVNPDHLEPVTRAENDRRARAFRTPQTHCKHGHLFDEANTRYDANGFRNCRACVAARARRYYHRQKAASREVPR